MAREETMIVAGVGCRRGTSAEEVERVVTMALDTFRVARGTLDAIATDAVKTAEPGIAEAARRLSVAVVGCAKQDLARVADAVLTPSVLVLETTGVPSIAEAAAIVVAGRNARLLGARVATLRATCAIAIGDGR
jgi:cobalt-precorrin 5A hydrolase